jgi:hypothetical protein
MRKLWLLSLVVFFFIFNQDVKAQKGGDLVYIQIKELTVESYAKWFDSIDKSSQLDVDYACIPAKIIGVRKEVVEEFKIKLQTTFKSIEKIELTQEEAEQKCAAKRSF